MKCDCAILHPGKLPVATSARHSPSALATRKKILIPGSGRPTRRGAGKKNQQVQNAILILLIFLTRFSALSPSVTHPVVLAADGDDHADPNRTDADGEPNQLANPQAKRQPLGKKQNEHGACYLEHTVAEHVDPGLGLVDDDRLNGDKSFLGMLTLINSRDGRR
jgi:hypothetical protein